MYRNEFSLFVVFITGFIGSVNFLPWRQEKYFVIHVVFTRLVKKRRVRVSYVMHIGKHIGYATVYEYDVCLFFVRITKLFFTAFQQQFAKQ